MGLFDDLSTAERLRAINLELSVHQKALYVLLVQLNIDPDSFDEESWSESLNMETPIGRVRHYIDLINSTRAKRDALSNE